MSGPPPLPALDDYAELVNGLPGGFVRVLGLRFLSATPTLVTAELTVSEDHVQPYGIVHGGVHASIVESIGSVGAALQALPTGRWVVGVENRTRFLRPVRVGAHLTASGRPAPAVGEDPVWQIDITDASGRLVAAGDLRLRALPPGTTLSGREVGIAGVDVAGGNE